MRESKQTTRVRDARAALLLTHPFFGVLSLKLALQEDSTIQTARVDSTSFRFNPAYVETLSNSHLKTLVAHEVSHLGLLHHAREGHRDHALWNDACDYAVNAMLKAEGFDLPAGALIDARFDGKAAESIYQTLESEKPEPDQGGQNGQGQGSGDQAQGENPLGSFDKAGPEGSAEAGEAEREWQENANEAIRAAASAGKLPAGVKRTVQAAIIAKADWRALLRRFMNDQQQTRSTWSKRNKRFPDICLPGKRNNGMGPLVIGVDTSGSITQAVLNLFAAEITAICEDLEPAAVHVVYCDAQVNHVDSFEHGETVKISMHGGGGTRFSPVFERVAAEDWNPAALVYLTDLDCSDWPAEPAYPVLWAGYDARGRAAPIGDTIAID